MQVRSTAATQRPAVSRTVTTPRASATSQTVLTSGSTSLPPRLGILRRLQTPIARRRHSTDS